MKRSKTILFLSLLLFTASAFRCAYANDEGYRYNFNSKSCENPRGERGYNPDFRGECGSLRGADLRGATFDEKTKLPFDHAEAKRRGMIFKPSLFESEKTKQSHNPASSEKTLGRFFEGASQKAPLAVLRLEPAQ